MSELSVAKTYYNRFLTPSERFEDAWTEDRNGCWIWQQCLFRDGYGTWYLNGKVIGAHRASWILFRGDIPDGMDVLHNCDVKRCVNPDHLRIGTHSENMIDAVVRGRTTKVLDADDVAAIRASTGMQKDVASQYGISQSLVCMIKKRQRWNHLP